MAPEPELQYKSSDGHPIPSPRPLDMARIVGGIGTSHVPTIAMAFDRGKQDDPDWQPLFRGYEPVAKWLAEKKPDVLFFCFNDHATTFFFDHYPTFRARRERRIPGRR